MGDRRRVRVLGHESDCPGATLHKRVLLAQDERTRSRTAKHRKACHPPSSKILPTQIVRWRRLTVVPTTPPTFSESAQVFCHTHNRNQKPIPGSEGKENSWPQASRNLISHGSQAFPAKQPRLPHNWSRMPDYPEGASRQGRTRVSAMAMAAIRMRWQSRFWILEGTFNHWEEDVGSQNS